MPHGGANLFNKTKLGTSVEARDQSSVLNASNLIAFRNNCTCCIDCQSLSLGREGSLCSPYRKQVLDDDKRKLRLYQERYLADGDLHSDGPGRARRFRWKNIGEFSL